jgi:urate oxidase
MLVHAAYGKSRVRLVKVTRHGDRDDLADLTVAIRFEGDFEAEFVTGDNRDVLPTDTMKNTVYALAAENPVHDPEAFGLLLARHFRERHPRLDRVRIDLTSHQWTRIARGERQDPHAFVREAAGARTVAVTVDRNAETLEAGIRDLLVLKSARSAFAGFLRDEYTTLPEAKDRLFATALTATWRYETVDVAFAASWHAVRRTLLDTFAEHDSLSVQHTMYAMGRQVLENCRDVASIHLVMPNKHHLPVDVSRFGAENRNEIFVATEEPHGLIEATLSRGA